VERTKVTEDKSTAAATHCDRLLTAGNSQQNISPRRTSIKRLSRD
jgi:hypothetical protein